MLKLRNIRARNIHQRLVVVDNAFRDERLHAKMIVLHTQMLQIASGEHQRPEVLINRLEQSPSRPGSHVRGIDVLDAAIAIDSNIISDASPARAAESFDGENVAFFHALIGHRLDEGDLLVSVDFVAQDVVACEAADCFDGDGLAFQLDFVAFHCFLDDLADVVDAGVDAGFLWKGLAELL